jgi:hypothetical protein
MKLLLALLLYGSIVIGGGIGWVRNLVALYHSDFGSVSGELIVRAIGVPVVPVGAVVGWFN